MQPILPLKYAGKGVVVVFGLLGACSLPPEYQATGSRSYQVGVLDGCDSGYNDAGRTAGYNYWQDTRRYVFDSEYARGWDEGHARCYPLGMPDLQRDEDEGGENEPSTG